MSFRFRSPSPLWEIGEQGVIDQMGCSVQLLIELNLRYTAGFCEEAPEKGIHDLSKGARVDSLPGTGQLPQELK